MLQNQIKTKIHAHIQQLSAIYIFVLLLLFIGVIFGAVIVNSMSAGQKQELSQYLNQFFVYFTKEGLSAKKDIFLQSYENNLKYIGMIWILGISLIGLPVIFILLFLKGIVVGFTVGLLVQQYGIKGFIISLASVLPQNFLMLPLFIYISAIAISLSLRIIRHQFFKNDDIQIKPLFMNYITSFGIIIIVLGIASGFEAYISPILMNGALKIVG